jgi:3-oxoacyl-[acyl-carrier-protein] synthase II
MGVITPLGLDLDESWEALVRGQSGISRITAFDPSGLRTRVAGQVKGFDPDKYLDHKEVKRFDRSILLALGAATQAASNAGLGRGFRDPDRIGVAVGNVLAGMGVIEHGARRSESAKPRLSSFFVPGSISSMCASLIAIRMGLGGPNLAVNTACASGGSALGQGMAWVRQKTADVVLAGGCEAAITRTMFAGYDSMRATTAHNDEPEKSSRPFDATRDGFVPAEGAGFMVLESLDHARDRGAEILAELTGFGCTCDAYHITAPDPDGAGAARCIRRCLDDAGATPARVDLINAHGTSTKANDLVETLAIKEVFGERANQVPVTANKSMIGHMIGAAGAVEAAFSVQAIRSAVIPPTINLENPDPQCDLDYMADGSRSREVRCILSNSFAFGGINASILLERFVP